MSAPRNTVALRGDWTENRLQVGRGFGSIIPAAFKRMDFARIRRGITTVKTRSRGYSGIRGELNLDQHTAAIRVSCGHLPQLRRTQDRTVISLLH